MRVTAHYHNPLEAVFWRGYGERRGEEGRILFGDALNEKGGKLERWGGGNGKRMME